MKVVITGGAGFIGSNLAAQHLARGDQVLVLDNFVRPGTRVNQAWLLGLTGDLEIREVDVRNFQPLAEAVAGADAVYHLAAQVAVTTSVEDPRTDFEVNALGTFNVLEAVRLHAPHAFLAYSSTNKVYGGMEELRVGLEDGRYRYLDQPGGVRENYPLDFHSPYGCSKGAGDQYVRDYARIYGLRTVVFRQSCIYGQRQMGNEDQGWVAHFTIQALKGRPVTIYGDGSQVRDVLHVDDLLAAFDAARLGSEQNSGEVFNIGGGPGNTLSLLELVAYLERRTGRPVQHSFADWRPGDQKVYVSAIGHAAERMDWEPSIDVAAGLDRLVSWIEENLDQIP